MAFEAMITAAGLSSRMGSDKALLKIRGKENITREIETLTSAEIETVTVITGAHEKERMEAAGKAGCPNLRAVRNPRYDRTQMFDSISIGLRDYLDRHPGAREGDGLFFVPVDEPLFSVFSVKALARAFAEEEGAVFTASYHGLLGHPLLIRASAIPVILRHDGTRGLRGALEAMGERFVKVPVPDPGAGLDADTPEDFEKLLEEARIRMAPGDDRCLELLQWFGQPPSRIAHCEAVAETAWEMAKELEEAGGILPEGELFLRKVRAAGWLHDIAKGQPDHAGAGALRLRELGYEEIAPWVGSHTDLPEELADHVNGAMLVYLADKLVKGDRRTTLEDRFSVARERFPRGTEAGEAVERRYRTAEQCLKAVELALRGTPEI